MQAEVSLHPKDPLRRKHGGKVRAFRLPALTLIPDSEIRLLVFDRRLNQGQHGRWNAGGADAVVVFGVFGGQLHQFFFIFGPHLYWGNLFPDHGNATL